MTTSSKLEFPEAACIIITNHEVKAILCQIYENGNYTQPVKMEHGISSNDCRPLEGHARAATELGTEPTTRKLAQELS
jgi:hypothetical protein